jgi:tetratricopeptide (TPR) repeat protein
MVLIYLTSFNNNNTIYGQIQTEETTNVVESDVKELISRGNSLHDLGNCTTAIEYYDKALSIDPTNATALNNKGRSLYELGRYDESIEYYDKVLAVNPKEVSSLSNKGLALDQLGKYKEAIEF